MRVELVNIQAIKSAVYELAETGITQIVGDNSNGKSILIKAMAFVANTLIKDKDERETIINDECSMGIIIMARDGMTLKVTITRERDNCRYELTRKNGEVISRSIREGGLEVLADEFGWITFEGNVCLQIFETFGIMPFVNNREATDYAIIDYITTDKVANNFVESYETVTYPAFKKYSSELKSNIGVAANSLDNLTFYDIPVYEDYLYKLKKCQRNIALMVFYTPTMLPVFKKSKYLDVVPYLPTLLPVFRIVPELPEMRSLEKLISDYHQMLNGVCPTCGTSLRDLGGHDHEV